MARFIEKSGLSIEEAITILEVESDFEGVIAEYEYLERKFGKRGTDWELEMQALIQKDNRYYDKIKLKLSDGTQQTIYFDITSFFGKGLCP